MTAPDLNVEPTPSPDKTTHCRRCRPVWTRDLAEVERDAIADALCIGAQVALRCLRLCPAPA